MSGRLRLCFVFMITSLTLLSEISVAVDTITPTLSLKDGQTLVSTDGNFELGFFTPGSSKYRYVGIWYKKIPIKTVVWVANRNSPIPDSSGVLSIGTDGNLVLLNQQARIFWTANATSKARNPVAQLLGSGNLVVRDGSDTDPQDYLWQSFDYPTDTLLPGMKLGWDLKTGLNRYLTSWKSPNDPSVGDYSFKIDPHGFPQAFLFQGLIPIYRSGPWNGIQFSGVPEMKSNDIVSFDFTFNEEEVYYKYTVKKSSVFSRLMVNTTGLLQRYTWELGVNSFWILFWYARKDQCDGYKNCGPYGICDSNTSPICECIQGFRPQNQKTWDLRDGSDGCVRKTNYVCQKDDGFLTLKGMKLPDSSKAFVDESMSLEECATQCRSNCSCTAYANTNINGEGSGCVFWVVELIDLREYLQEGGQDLYVRVAASELDAAEGTKADKRRRIILITSIIGGLGLLALAFSIIYLIVWRWRKTRSQWKKDTMHPLWRKRKAEDRSIRRKSIREKSQDLQAVDGAIASTRECYSDESNNDDIELPLFDFDTIETATDNFSDANKLGKGGFGSVYKGELDDGQEIAVKRLSKNSGQGAEEFKNEVMLIARLQHRNLVRLLGCCIECQEKILVYEYMQNKSLDSIIFNKTKSTILDWRKRFNIIVGIARGLLYLHQDSRFRIVHRDLKASNILLDGDMNPKISDFGMARIFGGDQTEANTKRVVGTYGYMSPEYAMDGLFSVKSDAFSFGVLVLEIISGKKNRGFYYSNNQHNLLGHAWTLWKEGRALELVDTSVGDSYHTYEVLRCIQVGLLCVQERAEDRPIMSTVVLMLSSETATMPQPKEPGFCLGRNFMEMMSTSNKQEQDSCTINEVTVTMLEAR
ncbi:PREDICTED: receptor-like serine/threonine-protein kinase SD1-8 [Nelumbo nucifera]|uniref:Receptor-like serine/threonine-protein kinase n=1 Tax=Nelumbo nucifera TaxID=4432 RepID=A0A1U7YTF2_NELNU|nr:PREDICTED: receptor-like serine/threonine-protein kinase SD1-8 [Nelumbo nucifera]